MTLVVLVDPFDPMKNKSLIDAVTSKNGYLCPLIYSIGGLGVKVESLGRQNCTNCSQDMLAFTSIFG